MKRPAARGPKPLAQMGTFTPGTIVKRIQNAAGNAISITHTEALATEDGRTFCIGDCARILKLTLPDRMELYAGRPM